MKTWNGTAAPSRGLKIALMAGIALFAADMAQSAAWAADVENIIVTARKREESILKAPVLIQAVSAQRLEDLKITTLESLTSITPGLTIAHGFGAVGSLVSMRGLGNGVSATLVDQSVQLNVDGATLPHGSFYKAGIFDMAQVEVLKGPQALFFGKGSSAGIIAITTADPTAEWTAKASAGYEIVGDQASFDAAVAGPLTDTLGIRLAGYYEKTEGWNVNPNPTIKGENRVPYGDDWGLRFTAKYDNADNFRAKLKVTQTYSHTNQGGGNTNQKLCSEALPQKPAARAAGLDNCKVDKYLQGLGDTLPYRPDLDYNAPNQLNLQIGSPAPMMRDGKPYDETDTTSIILNMDYDVADGLTATSVTAYSRVRNDETVRTENAPAVGLPLFIDIGSTLIKKDFAQELRLTSDWKDSWFNFMVGGVYTHESRLNPLFIGVQLNIPAFGLRPSYNFNQLGAKGDVYSTFAQVQLTPIENWELDLGGRYTATRKRITSIFNRDNAATSATDPADGELVSLLNPAVVRANENNFSPEFTLSYKPTDELTLFASYKHGYKGPAWSSSTTNAYPVSTIFPLKGETAKGGELGVKARLFEDSLTLTAAAYYYKYKNLQVSYVDGATLVARTSNAAGATVKGVELGLTYVPPSLPDLSLNAYVNYNDAYYNSYLVQQCWAGQTLAQGCTNPTTRLKDVSGFTLDRAPKWVGNFGFDYKTDITDEYAAAFNFTTNFSSRYSATAEYHPNGYQSFYATVDAMVRVGKLNGPWEFAVVGRNLSDKRYIITASDDGYVRPGNPTGLSDLLPIITRGREIQFRVTVRPEL